MNPFDDNFEEDEFTGLSKIDVRLHKRGRKSNTYVENWNLTKEELKTHLKTLKKTLGSNGSLKKNDKVEGWVLHLQGDRRNDVKSYLIDVGKISEDRIVLHG